MPRFKDRTDERYGRLVVLSHAGKNRWGKHLWLCKCDCGGEKTVVSDNLSSKKSKSCGCLKKEFLSKSGNQFGLYTDRIFAILKVQYSHLKRRHSKISRKECIDFETYKKLVTSVCFYCGIEYSRNLHDRTNESKKKKLLSETTVKCNGIDRFDSSEGYIKGNVCTCCKFCNTAKNTMSVVEFLNFIKRVHDYSFGSTGVACLNLNRNFIGIEKDKAYFDVAVKRIKEHKESIKR
jgi:hypothetical protein